MARALIVGGKERGTALARSLVADGWAVRVAAPTAARREAPELEGVEVVVADPARLGTLIDAIEGVAVIVWLLGDPGADADAARELNGGVLARLFEEIVDTPVRGVAFEAWGAGEDAREPALHANRTWRIGVAAIEAEPGETWLGAAREAVTAALG